MRYGCSRIGLSKSVLIIAGVAILVGHATQAHAQWAYAPPLGYAVPVAPVPVYAYRPVGVYTPVVTAYAPPVVYTQPVIVQQSYVAYSNPAIYAPAPAVVRDRVHYGALGGRVENYNVRGPGHSHLHLHSRDGWLGYHERVRYHR